VSGDHFGIADHPAESPDALSADERRNPGCSIASALEGILPRTAGESECSSVRKTARETVELVFVK
jgi:hypothetical protein